MDSLGELNHSFCKARSPFDRGGGPTYRYLRYLKYMIYGGVTPFQPSKFTSAVYSYKSTSKLV